MEVLVSIENFVDGEIVRELNSPRTLEACLRAGLDPSELYPKSLDAFKSKRLTSEMVALKLENYDKKRREKINAVKLERHAIIQYSERHNKSLMAHDQMANNVNFNQSGKASSMKAASAMIEMETKRIEALKRRQENELEKIVEREHATAELQRKIKRAEEEDVRKRQLHEKKVAEQRQEAAKKNQARLLEVAQKEKEEADKKRDIARRDQEFDEKRKKLYEEEEKKRVREARLRDEERTAKIEEYRRKTDLLIQNQFKLAEESREKMLDRENRVQNQLAMKKLSKKEESQAQKEKTMIRMNTALVEHHRLHEDKKKKFYDRQKQAIELTEQNQILERQKIKKQVEEREKRDKQRIHRLIDSYRTRMELRKKIIERRQEKDKTFDKVQFERNAHIAMMKFAADVKIHDKIENVERVSRINEFNRLQTLKRIEDDETRYEEIQRQKKDLMTKRREEIKFTMIRKHAISETMDQMRITNDYSLLDKLFIDKKSKNSSTMGGTLYKGDDEGQDDVRLNQTA